MAYSTDVLADTPIAAWALDETSGTNANDATANNIDLTYTNSPLLNQASIMPAVAGGCVDLDGTNDTIIGPGGGLLSRGGPVTIEAWIRMDVAPALGAHYYIGGKVISYDLLAYNPSGATKLYLRAGAGGGSLLAGTTTLVAGTTYHCVGVFPASGAGNWEVWLNGVRENFGASPGVSTNGNAFRIGDSGGNFFNGKVQWVAVYDYLLSSTRIGVHYTSGSSTAVAVLTGGAVANGTSPTTRVAGTTATTVAQATSPTTRMPALTGGATGLGTGPATRALALTGPTVALGTGPVTRATVTTTGPAVSGGTGPVPGVTPATGGATGNGTGPSGVVTVSTTGGVTALGVSPIAKVQLGAGFTTPGGGVSPTIGVTPGTGGGVAQGTTAATVVFLTTGGGAIGRGTSPTDLLPTIDFAGVGGALAGGTSPGTARTTVTVGGVTASTTTPGVTVGLLPTGVLANGRAITVAVLAVPVPAGSLAGGTPAGATVALTFTGATGATSTVTPTVDVGSGGVIARGFAPHTPVQTFHGRIVEGEDGLAGVRVEAAGGVGLLEGSGGVTSELTGA